MNIEAARQYYKESNSNRKMLEGIFTKEELGVNTIPTQEEFNKFFEEEILSKVDPSKTRFLYKNNFSRIELCNSKGEWLFNYDYNPEKPHFWYQYDRVNCVLQDKFSLQDGAIERLMKSLVETNFNLMETQPKSPISWAVS